MPIIIEIYKYSNKVEKIRKKINIKKLRSKDHDKEQDQITRIKRWRSNDQIKEIKIERQVSKYED